MTLRELITIADELVARLAYYHELRGIHDGGNFAPHGLVRGRTRYRVFGALRASPAASRSTSGAIRVRGSEDGEISGDLLSDHAMGEPRKAEHLSTVRRLQGSARGHREGGRRFELYHVIAMTHPGAVVAHGSDT